MTPKVIKQCPTEWADDAFIHRCHKLWPHDYEHECVCGDRCEQIIPNGVLTIDRSLTPEQVAALRVAWQERYPSVTDE